jgi:hypothetical protein
MTAGDGLSASSREQEMGAGMVDQWVRLGMAVVIIALISIALYQFGGRASAVEPNLNVINYRH